jgi:type VI secretion system protein ImpA
MPLREDILTPVPGDNPSGENLRYAPLYDKIKEARRQDDDAPQGDWKTTRKVADYKTVIKLAGEAIATRSKDLQLAAWLTEALLHTERIPGLTAGLNMIRGLIENFWDTLYPELEDGEAEFRAAPLDWVGGAYLTLAVKQVPLTKAGYTLLAFHEAKAVGREEEAAQDTDKHAEFQAAIAEGRVSMDEWEKAFTATSKAFYVQLAQDIETALQTIEDLQPVCEEKFGEFTPSYNQLRVAIEEVQRLGNQLLEKKKELEPDPEDVQPVDPEVEEEVIDDGTAAVSVGGGAAVQQKRISRTSSVSLEPADKDDAVARVAAVAAFWRKEDPSSPAPYLLLRGMRWGELRTSSSLDSSLFEAPSTAIRTNLKRLATEGSYAEVIELAENAMAMPCGRAWLDLQRYAVAALDNLGYSAISEAIKAELKSLVRDFPDLPEATLLDDTPTANRETQEWLKEFAQPNEAQSGAPAWSPPPSMEESVDSAGTQEDAPPDSFALAMQAASSGRSQEALELLMAEIGRQNSGRGRFQRKMQLAQICLTVGQEPIAHSILEELVNTIDRHDLEHWEAPDVVAHTLTLLWRCMNRNGEADAEIKQKLYARICRLDPVQALEAGR